ncbi:hypothetical protein [Planococcus plakortidis]|uniref:hypothetical protein n=1 Tax=Planococcus plakortidis TaxID=1038856 RepID=UPI003984ECB3
MASFTDYLDIKYGNDLTDIQNGKLTSTHVDDLLNQYKDIVLVNLIQQFQLGPIFDAYKSGGNVTTLHNAEKYVFANAQDEERFMQNYSQELRRDLYESGFKQNRKKAFQNNTVIVDDYTGKVLNKDGRAHRDHIVSASEIQQNNAARLYMSDQTRGEMATKEKNLAWTDGSLNQSKGENDLIKWMNKDNKKDSTMTNEEYYNLDQDKVKAKYAEAKQHVDGTIKKERTKYYVKNVTSTGIAQGFAMGQKQAIGLVMYEFQKALMIEMKVYFKKYKTLHTIEEKISEFQQACKNVSAHMISKSKEIFTSFSDGFISGFVGNLITVFINTFATTAKNVVRILNEGIHGLFKAVKILVNPPKGMTREEALLEASKIISVSVITTIGVILTEAFVTYLLTTPFSPFAHLIGGVLGGILTGIVSVTVVYSIDHYVEILAKLKETMNLLVYDLEISAAEIRSDYYSTIESLDEGLQAILQKIYTEYEELHLLTRNAYNTRLSNAELVHNSLKLANKLGVREENIVSTKVDVINFFNN